MTLTDEEIAIIENRRAWARKNLRVTYTPGPWAQDTQYPDEIVAGRLSIGEVRGARFVGTNEYEVPAQTFANARLIAAAPELLEALEAVLRIADRKHDVFDMAHAAIAKALGSKP